jgi:serine/threonine protein phosphatase 1
MRLDKDRHIFAISDIHSCPVPLAAILNVIEPFECRTVFAGDFVDRGPDSPKTIQMLVDLKLRRPDYVFLLGNHDHEFVTQSGFHSSDKYSAAFQYKQIGGIPNDHLEFLKNLLPYWESDNFCILHGGISKDVHLPIEQHGLDEILWSYSVSKQWQGRCIVRGHRVFEDPIRNHEKCISIDTGISYGLKLSCVILDDHTEQLVGYIQSDPNGRITKTFL